ncbi:DNA cytosine methyltransferase [Gemmata sp. JC673]|uniref:DNA (cytosine-5-)-methyltransferase n=1 Tax=Gemmata algarum TaxID=2975278 RepID=A0ABU5ETF4_9BACT|nr:DNA cytosine methyltransferase [Gemmata algarum]MDY3558440.1 DNA cytosine methyltransferase [Gemmata algarum]
MASAISLFSGCGGCSLGLSQAGFSVSLAAELDDDACQTYSGNIGAGNLWQTDLGRVTAADILRRVGARAGEVALMTGGPPCQGFSSAGAKDWSDPRNSLLKQFVDLVIGVRPVWFVMENVEGLLTSNDGYYITEAVTHFLKAGYWVRAKKVYMERYGLPQRRKRVIVVGNREGCGFDFPEETHGEVRSDMLFGPTPQLSVLDAISDMTGAVESGEVTFNLPPANDYQRQMRGSAAEKFTLHTVKRVNETTAQRIRHLGQGKTMKDLPQELQHASFTRRAFRRVMDGTPTEKRGGAPSGLKRLIGADPSLTITSASPVEFVHPVEDRLLTLRECARIQSFPDSFSFAGSWSSIATQIGNAIPPAFMKLLAEHIAGMATWKAKEPSTGKWFGIEATKASAMSPALERTLAGLREKTSAYLR